MTCIVPREPILVGQRVRIRKWFHLAGATGLVHEAYVFGSVEVALDGGSFYFVCGSRAEAPDANGPEDVLEHVYDVKLIESSGDAWEPFMKMMRLEARGLLLGRSGVA